MDQIKLKPEAMRLVTQICVRAMLRAKKERENKQEQTAEKKVAGS